MTTALEIAGVIAAVAVVAVLGVRGLLALACAGFVIFCVAQMVAG